VSDSQASAPAAPSGDLPARGSAARIVAALTARGLRLAVVETTCGGAITASLTAVPGASRCLAAGFVPYGNDAKRRLGVPAALLAREGAVSAAVAEALACAARDSAAADVALAETGLAGPQRGRSAKPVGECHLALATPNGTIAARHRFTGDREAIRARIRQATLALLAEWLDNI